MSILLGALALPLFQRALLAGVLVSVLCGTMGAFVVMKRLSSLAGGLSHAAFGGIGLAFVAGIHPLLGAVVFCLLGAILLALVYRHRRESLDTLIAIFWSAGMAIGVICLALSPGYAPDLSSYLFGSLLFVPDAYLWATGGVSALTVILVGRYFRELQAVVFDEEFAQVLGLPVDLLFVGLISFIALATVTLLQVAGAVLTIALLTTPTVIALQWSRSLAGVMIVGSLVTLGANTGGLFLGYWCSMKWSLELPMGPLIILLLTTVYGLSSAWHAVRSRTQLEN